MRKIHFANYFSICLFCVLTFTQVLSATEPLCHIPTSGGICYYDDYNSFGETCGAGDEINISGVVTGIHSSDFLPVGFPVDHYYQHYFRDADDTTSRFTHYSNMSNLSAANKPITEQNRDSLYAKAIQMTHFKKWEIDEPYYDSISSDMMDAVDPNFILVMWALPIQVGDSLVISKYAADLDLMCSNSYGKGTFDGEYTIYPASTTTSLPNAPSPQQQKTPVRYYTVDGKLQAQRPEFVPVVEVGE